MGPNIANIRPNTKNTGARSCTLRDVNQQPITLRKTTAPRVRPTTAEVPFTDPYPPLEFLGRVPSVAGLCYRRKMKEFATIGNRENYDKNFKLKTHSSRMDVSWRTLSFTPAWTTVAGEGDTITVKAGTTVRFGAAAG